MNTYQIRLKRNNITMFETFTGSRWALMVYKFKMRKWEVEIL